MKWVINDIFFGGDELCLSEMQLNRVWLSCLAEQLFLCRQEMAWTMPLPWRRQRLASPWALALPWPSQPLRWSSLMTTFPPLWPPLRKVELSTTTWSSSSATSSLPTWARSSGQSGCGLQFRFVWFCLLLICWTPLQYLPHRCVGFPWGPDSRPAAVGEPGDWRASRHRSGLQPSWPGHHEQTPPQCQGAAYLWMALFQILGHWLWVTNMTNVA